MEEKIQKLNILMESSHLNIHAIRTLCRENPNLIELSGKRLQVWSIFLLGNEFKESDYQIELSEPSEACGEQHVLEADVHLTRAEVELLRTPETRRLIKIILQKFCLDHEIQYKQGMNEVLAPFLVLNTNTKDQLLTYALFRAFLFRYLDRFFCVDDSSYLYKAFRMFQLLFVYFDPQLSFHLSDMDFIPELYCPQWFLTLFARSLPINHVFRLWDMIISIDDPAFTFFLAYCMIHNERQKLLSGDIANVPEILSGIQFVSEEQLETTVKDALNLYKNTPRCIIRNLRLCCVSTVELTPLPHTAKERHRINIEKHDESLNIQTRKNSLVITPQELVESMINGHSPKERDDFSNILQQYVIIDVRSYEDSVLSGGGSLPRAIQLEPEFLNRPEAFDVWVQHFDGTRGCNIVIVDLPPAQWSGFNLWRRLLLGEGDGSLNQFKGRCEFDDIRENKRRLDALLGKRNNKTWFQSLDQENKEDESYSDLTRPSVLLAIALQRHHFPNVSILDGGFPELVTHLLNTRGTVEPLIINHENDKWISFLKQTGRYVEPPKGKKIISTPSTSEQQKRELSLKVDDLSELEKSQIALKVAERLSHPFMAKYLQDRINSLQGVNPL